MALPDDPAARHREVAATFGRLVDGAGSWQAPAPVDGWTARDVVAHLVEWFPGFLAGGGVSSPPARSSPTTRPPRGTTRRDAVQDLVDERGDESFTHPYAGTHRLADAVDRFYTADVFMHSWDLARATGQAVRLDEDFAATLLDGMRPIEDVLRSSGQYGAPVPVPDDAPVVDRLMGFIGRDPDWAPPAG